MEKRIDWYGDCFIAHCIPLTYITEYLDHKERNPDITPVMDYSEDPPVFDYFNPELFDELPREQRLHNDSLYEDLDGEKITWEGVIKKGVFAENRINPLTAPCEYVDEKESNIKVTYEESPNRIGWDVNFWATNKTRFLKSPYGNFVRVNEYGITFIHPNEVEYLYKIPGFSPVWSDKVRPYVITREMMKTRIKFAKGTNNEIVEMFSEVKNALSLKEPKDRVFYYMNGV